MSDQITKKPRVSRKAKENPPTPATPVTPAMHVGLQFKLPAGVFRTALRGTEHALPKRTTLPVLTYFGVEGIGDHLTITATDLEKSVWRSAVASIGAPGKFCLPAITSSLIANLDEATPVQVSVVQKTATAQLKAGNVKSDLKGMDGSEFPGCTPLGVYAACQIQLTRHQLEEIVKRVNPFAAGDESRPILNGIHVQFNYPDKDNSSAAVKFVAADGFRAAELTLFDVPINFNGVPASDWSRSVIIPPGLFVEALCLANECGDDEQMFALQIALAQTKTKTLPAGEKITYLGGGVATVTGTNGGAWFNLIEGTFPQVDKILSGGDKSKVIPLPVVETLDALESAGLFAADSLNTVRLACDVKGKRTQFSAVSPETGDFNERVVSEFGDRAPAHGFTMGFNVKYLTSLIKAVTWNDGAVPVQMLVSSPNAPAFMNLPHYRTAVMPMHLNTGSDKSDQPAKPASVPTPTATAPKATDKPVAPAPTSVISAPTATTLAKVAPAGKPTVTTPTSAGKSVTCPCGKSLAIVAGGADVCACGKILDDQGQVVG